MEKAEKSCGIALPTLLAIVLFGLGVRVEAQAKAPCVHQAGTVAADTFYAVGDSIARQLVDMGMPGTARDSKSPEYPQ